MTEVAPDYSVLTSSTATRGRTLNTIRQHHLVIDTPLLNEEINPAEAFLAGISACGVTLIEAAAQALGIRLQRMKVGIDGFRQPGVAAFDHITMCFTLMGPSDDEAAVLIGRYRDG